MKEYKIGEKIYVQKRLTIGQVKQLTKVLEGTKITGLDIASIASAVGDKLPDCLAVILCEKDTHLKDKDLSSFTKEIEFEIEGEQGLEILADFLDLTPLSSMWERVVGLIEKVSEKMNNLSPDSEEETTTMT